MKNTYKIFPRFFFRLLLFSFLFIANYSLLTVNCFSQPSITWYKIYNGPETANDGAYAICKSQTSSTYYVGGISGSHAYVLKINDYGDTIWTKLLTNGILIKNIVGSSDGGCVFSGIAGSMLTVKLDSNGNIIWQRTYSISWEEINCLINTPDGGYIGCGAKNTFEALVFKIDSIGNLLWTKSFSGNSSLVFYSVKSLSNGGYVLAGLDAGFGYHGDGIILRIDNSGNLIWRKIVTALHHDASAKTIDTLNNGFIISGGTMDTTGITGQNGRCYFSKLDTSGNVIYSKIVPYVRNDHYDNMSIVTPNRFVFSSVTTSPAQDTFYAKLTMVDTLGKVLSTRLLPSIAAYVEIYAIQPTGNNDIIFAGPLDDYYTSLDDILLVRTDINLNFPPIGLKNISTQILQKYRLYQNYPNPFNPTTNIKFDIPQVGQRYIFDLQLKVYDITGKEVATILSEELKPGTYEVDFDGTNYPSGVYFYRIKTEQFTQSKKMVLVK